MINYGALLKELYKQVVEQERRFPENHTIKAQFHTWLAWQQEPGKPMGQAITKKFLDSNSPSALQFISWVTRVFGLRLE